MKRKSKSMSAVEDRAEVDLTPMLDVIFIMLIFFIVAASFSSEKTIALNQPEQSPEQKKTHALNLLIHVDSTNDIKIDKRSIDERAVKALVSQHLAANPHSQIIVRAHEMATTNTYVAIADQVRRVTKGRLMLMTYND